MASTQLRRSCSPLGGAGTGTKHVRPHGRGRFEVWRGPEHAASQGWSGGEKAQVGGFCSAEWPGSCWRSARSRGRLAPPRGWLRRSNRSRWRALRLFATVRRALPRRARPRLAVAEATSTGVAVVHAFDPLTCWRRASFRPTTGSTTRSARYVLPVRTRFAPPSGGGARSPPAGARARASHVSRDVRPTSSPSRFPRRAFILFVAEREDSRAGRPLDPGEGRSTATPPAPLLIARGGRRSAHPPSGPWPSVLNRPPSGRDSLMAVPRWPSVGQQGKDNARRQPLVQRRALEPRGRDRVPMMARWRAGERRRGQRAGRADPSHACSHRCSAYDVRDGRRPSRQLY